MNRRSFLKALVALPVVAKLAPLLPKVEPIAEAPAIYGLHKVAFNAEDFATIEVANAPAVGLVSMREIARESLAKWYAEKLDQAMLDQMEQG